jgi:hypothetical protein
MSKKEKLKKQIEEKGGMIALLDFFEDRKKKGVTNDGRGKKKKIGQKEQD